jgi:tetratricopeptide (TPR) repeat protein
MNAIVSKYTLCLILILLTLCGSSYSQDKDRISNWEEDLDYMVERLEVMHPNVYANISQEDLHKQVEVIKSRIPEMADTELVMAIHELIALIQDMHTGVALWEGMETDLVKSLKLYPLVFYKFEDGIYIASADEKYKGIVGKKVINFNNLTAKETLSRTLKIINGDNYWGKLEFSFFYLSFADGLEYVGVENATKELKLGLQSIDGSEFSYTLEPLSFPEAFMTVYLGGMGREGESIVFMNSESDKPLPLYLSNPNDAYWYSFIPEEKAMYVCLLSMQPKSPGDFDRFYAELLQEIDEKKVEKLILDVRNNDGGDHFELPLMKGVIGRSHLDKPDKLFVIQGRATGSASQHFVTQFSMYTNAAFIGENTGGKPNHYGAQRSFKLPHSQLPIRSSIIFHQDETEWNTENTAEPDFYALLSSDDFRNNVDPALELIFNYDNIEGLPEQFVKQLGNAYTEGTFADVKEAYTRFFKEHSAAGLNKEALLFGFNAWLQTNKSTMEDYTQLSHFQVEELPSSYNAWYFLAVRLQNSGDIEGAIKCLRKSLDIFPGNVHAERRLKLIQFEKTWH